MVDEHQVGQRLRALRKAAGRTQGEVAADIGVSRATVAQMELGNRAIKISDAERVARPTVPTSSSWWRLRRPMGVETKSWTASSAPCPPSKPCPRSSGD